MVHRKIKQTNKKKKSSYRWYLLVGMMAILCTFAGSFAKYTHREKMEKEGDSGQFYFTSNYLTENEKTYTLSANATQIDIELRNYADELRWSDNDISYTYSVSKDENNILETSTGKIVRESNKGTKSDIKIQDMTAGTYKVTVVADTPYTKTLKGRFIIPKEDDSISYTISDSSGSPYVLLTVSTKTYDGKIKISWPEGVIPDSTQEIFENVNTWNNNSYSSGDATTQVSAYSSYTYQFFKTDTAQTYDKNTIKVEKTQ